MSRRSIYSSEREALEAFIKNNLHYYIFCAKNAVVNGKGSLEIKIDYNLDKLFDDFEDELRTSDCGNFYYLDYEE